MALTFWLRLLWLWIFGSLCALCPRYRFLWRVHFALVSEDDEDSVSQFNWWDGVIPPGVAVVVTFTVLSFYPVFFGRFASLFRFPFRCVGRWFSLLSPMYSSVLWVFGAGGVKFCVYTPGGQRHRSFLFFSFRWLFNRFAHSAGPGNGHWVVGSKRWAEGSGQ